MTTQTPLPYDADAVLVGVGRVRTGWSGAGLGEQADGLLGPLAGAAPAA